MRTKKKPQEDSQNCSRIEANRKKEGFIGMNMNQIGNMILRVLLRRAVNTGVNAGIDAASSFNGKRKKKQEMPEPESVSQGLTSPLDFAVEEAEPPAPAAEKAKPAKQSAEQEKPSREQIRRVRQARRARRAARAAKQNS